MKRPCPTNPAAFREWLSGQCEYSDPPGWTFTTAPGTLAIVPASTLIVLAGVFLVVFCAVGILAFLAGYHSDRASVFGVVFMLVGTIVGGLGLGVWGYALAKYLADYFRGAYSVWSSHQTVALSRDGAVISIADVRGWRLVSGNWIGTEGKQKQQDYPMSELQLIVKSSDGPVAYAVVGGKAGSITAKAQKVADLTGLPLEIVEQHQGVSERLPSRLMQWEGLSGS